MNEIKNIDIENKIEELKEKGLARTTIPDEMWENENFAVAFANNFPGAWSCFMPEKHKSNKKVALAAVKSDGNVLQDLNDSFKNDEQIVLAAVTSNGHALEYANERLGDNEEIVFIAAKSDGYYALRYGVKYRNNERIVLAAVTNNGNALEYADDELKDNEEIVLAAVTNNGNALEYASLRLRANKEMVLTAVSTDGSALKYASDELRGDKEVVMAAMRNGGSVNYIKNREDLLLGTQENTEACKEIAREFGIDFFVHFTPAANLESILKRGLRTRKDLRKQKIKHVVTDQDRLDGMEDTVCFSVSKPNNKMLFYKRGYWEGDNQDFVILRIKPDIILERNTCYFFDDNAANHKYNDGDADNHAGISRNQRDSIYDFMGMFEKATDDDGNTKYKTKSVQAEIMCKPNMPGCSSRRAVCNASDIDSFVFQDRKTADKYRDMIESKGHKVVIEAKYYV